MRIWIIILSLVSLNAIAAEGLHSTFYQYSPFATQGMQVCKFPLATNLYDIATTRVLLSTDGGSSFTEKPRQQVASNFLAVVTDILADGTNIWWVMTNATPASYSGMNYLTIITNGGTGTNLYQVTNGLTGVQVINTNLAQTSNLFPIVNWQLYDRSWCFTTSKVYEVGLSGSYTTNLMHCTNLTVEIIDSGPLLFQAKVTQLFSRQGFSYITATHPAGTGSNVVFIEMQAFRPIVNVVHLTDAQEWYRFDGNSAKTTVNQFRYRNVDYCFLSSQYGGRLGYQFGTALADVAASNQKDIIMPMLPQIDVEGVAAGTADGSTLTNASKTTIGITRIGEANQGGTGHYTRGSWYVLEDTNSTSSATAVYGIGNGPTSLALGNTRNTGFAPFYRTNGAVHGFQFQTEHIGTETLMYTNTRLEYFLYTGSEQMHTNSSSVHYHPMTAEFDKVNYFSLAKQTDWRVADSVGVLASRTNRGTFALPRSYLTNLMSRLRGGEAGLYDSMLAQDSSSQDITRALNDSTGFYSRVLLTNVIDSATSLFQAHMQGDGSLNNAYNFTQGSQIMGRDLSRIETLEMLNEFDTLSAKLLWQARMAGLLYARCLFDEDYYPVGTLSTVVYNGSAGTANMPIQFTGQRRKASIHYYPEFTNGLYSIQNGIDTTVSTLDGLLNAAGAPTGSPHYNGASTVPQIENMMMLYHRGFTNIMLSSLRPKMTNYARWAMSMATPPEVRLSQTNRYTVQFGDGQWLRDPLFGQLAEVVSWVDTNQARELKWQWNQIGQYINAYFVPGVLTIRVDSNWASNAPVSANFPGYYGAIHTQVGTGREDALWMMHGNWPSDHIGYYNAGMPSFYLLGMPVGVLRNYYSASEFTGDSGVSGAWNLAGVIPTNTITYSSTNVAAWRNNWPWDTTVTNTIFASFQNSGIVDCKLTSSNDVYYTTAAIVSPPSRTFSVALVDDRFTNTVSHYLTVSLNVTNDVGGAKSITPFNESATSTLSLGQTNWIGAGVHVFTNQGASWPNHPDTAVAVQHAYHVKDTSNMVNAVYFNTTASPGERNLQFRITTSNNVAHLIVARKPGATACTINTNGGPGAFTVVNGSEELRVGTNTWEYSLRNVTNAAAIFQGTATLTATNGIIIAGGPAELLTINNTNRTLSVDGLSGIRTITPTQSATNNSPFFTRAGGKFRVYTDGARSYTLR